MGRITFVVAMAAIGSAGPAAAQSCGPATGMPLAAQEIRQLLGGRWACVSLSESEHWNELHSFPFVLDYKQGPAEPGNVDPAYSFCSAAGGLNLAVTISATHC